MCRGSSECAQFAYSSLQMHVFKYLAQEYRNQVTRSKKHVESQHLKNVSSIFNKHQINDDFKMNC